MDRVGMLRFCEDALAHYGPTAQAEKAVEELLELRDSLINLRGFEVLVNTPMLAAIAGRPAARKAVIDEIADVIIMVEQMRIAFGAKAVDERIAFKIERQRQRMQEGE